MRGAARAEHEEREQVRVVEQQVAAEDRRLGADQEPDCLDWIASCSGSSWGSWMVLYNTLPQAYRFVPGLYAYAGSARGPGGINDLRSRVQASISTGLFP